MEYTEDFLMEAHKGASYHRAAIMQSAVCGCFCCRKTFSPVDIDQAPKKMGVDGIMLERPHWIDKKQTAICPLCGIDSVLPDTYPVSDPAFLVAMERKWFGLVDRFKKK